MVGDDIVCIVITSHEICLALKELFKCFPSRQFNSKSLHITKSLTICHLKSMTSCVATVNNVTFDVPYFSVKTEEVRIADD